MKTGIRNTEKRVFWQHHIMKWESSGQSKREYCRDNGVSYNQFTWWYNRLQEQGVQTLQEGFVALKYQQQEKPECICIEAHGIRVELAVETDMQTLVRVIRALREAVCA